MKKSSFFKKNFKEGSDYIKKSKNFIYVALAIFVLFIVVGYLVPPSDSIKSAIQNFIEELFEETENMTWFELAKFLFLNNVQSSFFGMIFGVFFGLFPLMVVVVNGYLLGFVASRVVGSEGIFTLWRLFPHGIFEIPAVLISVGLGLKLGTFILQKNKTKSLKGLLIKSLKAFFVVVVPLLILAAIIEASLIVLSG